MSLSTITFFERFEADILSGKKTITIRDASEKDYAVNSIVQVSTYENNRWFCALKIKNVIVVKVTVFLILKVKNLNIVVNVKNLA